MLPQFPYRRGFPTAPGLGTWRSSGDELAMMLLDVFGYGSPGTLETKPTGQLLADERVIKWFADRDKLPQKLLGWFGPERLVVASGGLEPKALLPRQPLGPQIVKPRSSDLQSLGGCLPVHVAAVK